jgi:hypothetical protein
MVLTTLLVGFRAFHLTRIDIPFLLGTLWTQDRDKAKWTGSVLHIFIGWVFAFLYATVFAHTGIKTVFFGMLLGFLHAVFVLSFGMNLVEAIHPRMATEERGPEPTRMLEPPGFMVLNYGRGTPLATIIAHMIYGGILGF